MFKFLPYFKMVAENHPDILSDDYNESRKRFHRANGTGTIDELLLSQKAIESGHGIICIDNESGLFASNGNDSFTDTQFYSFAIWGKANEVDDFNLVENVKRGNKDIFISIRNKMILDFYGGKNGLNGLNIRSIRYQSAGPVADHYYLLYVNFTVQDPDTICTIPQALDFEL